MALDELQDQKSFGAHWSRLEEPYGDVTCKLEKNTAHLFRNKIPCKITGHHQKNTSNSRKMLTLFWGMNQ